METRIWGRTTWFYGFLTWLIPFVISFFFFGKNREPVIPMDVFKSIMIVVGCLTGAILLVKLISRSPASKSIGLQIGLVWFAINLVLDLLILVPMTKMSLAQYFGQIGIRYLVIPIMSVAIASIKESTVRTNGRTS